MQVMQQSLLHFDSQADVIQVHKYGAKWETLCMTAYTHYLRHALLFQCIFAHEYKCLSSLLTIHRLIVSKQNANKIVELNMNLVHCVVQYSFHDLQ